MTTTLLRAGALACALLTTTALTAPAMAQIVNPRFSQTDDNGVDLVTGRFNFSIVEGTIGSGEGALTLSRTVSGSNAPNEWVGLLYRRTVGGTSLMHVEFGNIAETFTISGSTYTSTLANGGTLVGLGGGQHRYTAADGSQIVYENDYQEQGGIANYIMSAPQCFPADAGTCAIPLSITRPNGMIFTINWDIVPHCDGYDGELNCINPTAFFRFDGVTSSANYSFGVSYQTDSTGGSFAPPPDWYKQTGASFTNLASAPSPLPSSSYAYPSTGVFEVTDTGARTWRFDATGGAFAIRRPGSSSNDIVVSYSGGLVSQVVRDGVATTYARSTSGSTLTTTITRVDGDSGTSNPQTVVVANLSTGRITSMTDPLGNTTGYQYDGNGRLTRITRPEDNYVQFTYDARGNVTETRAVAKSGTGLDPIVTEADYPASCSNVITCNRPTATRDALDQQTDYTWSSTHGGLLTVTAPAPTGGATRPQTRIAYSQVTAVSGQPVYLPTNISRCQTTSSCDSQADEAETNISYGTANLLPSSVSSGSGNGTLVATSAATYDNIGNLLTVDGPLSGTADTTRIRYNAAREAIGVIGPDPDGGGSLKHRAQRITRDGGGRPTDIETGTVNSQSDGDWASMTVLEEIEQDYDANHRPSVRRLESGGTIYALIQTSYDGFGRVDCVAHRMNSSEFAPSSLPASACTLDTQGSFGPDRITRNIYTLAGQLERTRVALGTAQERDAVIRGYTANGLLSHIIDGENNLTDYVHDGHDRLEWTFFPSASQGALAASSTDYERLTFDANGNVTNARLRDNTNIALDYDALNRLIEKDLPGSEPTVTYTYDLLSRLTGASASGHSLTFSYDALGRQLTESGPHGTLTSEYDLAGRRTRLAYPGSTALTIGYTYNLAGETTEIRENPAGANTLLASFVHDDRGRRTSLTRGNGTTTSYGYDNVSRLTELAQNLNGTSSDLTLGFTLNPAGQIVANTRSNDAYSFTGHANGNLATAADGLNRLITIGGTAAAHDARGNLTNDTVRIFAYSVENRLRADSAGASQSYDPLGRLYFTYHLFADPPSSGTYLLSDGGRFVGELDGSHALLRRYVFGPGVDEPLVWYEGSGLSDRRWLHADERGSVIAVSDGSGNLVGTRNRYDEYGNVQGTLSGRFGYTGQAFVPEFGLYYYRARIYNPALGRFMQTDPIRYWGGMNLYAYVGNDPVNFLDPNGRCAVNMGLVKKTDWGNGKSTSDVVERWVDFSSCWGGPGHEGFHNLGSPLDGGQNAPGTNGEDCSSLIPEHCTIVVRASAEQSFTVVVNAPPVPWDPQAQSQYYEMGPSELELVRQTYIIARDQIRSGYPLSNRRINMHPYRNTGLASLPPPVGQYYTTTVNDSRGDIFRMVVDTGNLGLVWYTPNHYEWFIPFLVDD